MGKKLIKMVGKWGWYLGEDRKVYKSFDCSGSYMAWDCPSWVDLDAEWARLFEEAPIVKEVVLEKVKVASKPRELKDGVGFRMEQIRRKKLGINNVVGRPSKVSHKDFCEFYFLNKGCSIAFLARKFEISGVSARKYVKKCENKKGE